MKPNSMLLLAGLLAAAPAFAAGTLPEKANAKAAAHAALSNDAGEDVNPREAVLPKTASSQATNALKSIAFGAQGKNERAAHSKGSQHADEQAGDEGASRSAQGAAASAARSANADSHAAAGLARASARTGAPTGTPPRGR
jgi:hypothetical protein